MSLDSKLILNRIILKRNKIPSFDKYPFNIEVIKNLDTFKFTSPVTFFVGENGVGKSTLIEALAVSLGLPAEGGTQNFMYETRNTTSELSNYLDYVTNRRAETKFFLRAESFYNFASEVQNLAENNGYRKLLESYGGSLHECSHGESFLNLVKNRFSGNGLYILDEPEAALSPERQLSLLCLIDDLVKCGSQFIIATHSPLLISYRNGKIYNMNDNLKEVKYKDTDIYSIYRMYLDDPDGMQHRLFDL